MTSNAPDASLAPAPPKTAARRFSQSVSVLLDEQTRAYILGCAVQAADKGGYARLKEGESLRDLLDEAIAARYDADPKAYTMALRAGRSVLAQRAAEAA